MIAYRVLACSLSALALAIGPGVLCAVAEVDLSGEWRIESVIYQSPECGDLIQSGTRLDVTLPFPSNAGQPFDFTGTVDPVSGEFSVAGPMTSCECGRCGCAAAGAASADGSSFNATLTCTNPVNIVINGHELRTCLTLPLPLAGVRAACGEEPSCPGDCNADLAVTADELITGVAIILNERQVDDCPAFDADGNGAVAISEVLQAINAALAGCG